MENKTLTNKQVLLAAINKAQENTGGSYDAAEHLILPTYLGTQEISLEDFLWLSKEKIIFDHEFAKALWGEKMEKSNEFTINCEAWFLGWEDYLQQMVLEDDPIEYLRQFLDENNEQQSN